MKKQVLVAIMAFALASFSSCVSKRHDGNSRKINGKSAQQISSEDSVSQALGVYFGAMINQQMKSFPLPVNKQIFTQALSDKIAGIESKMCNEQEARQILIEATTRAEKMAAEKTLKEGEAFIADYAKKEGVKHTESGIYYRIIKEGEGPRPTALDTVLVNYEGRNVQGKIFDSSFQRNNPLKIALMQVIPGWTEGVCLMNKGSEYEFVIPAKLAYGEKAMSAEIPANSTLIFKIQLIDFFPPQEADIETVKPEIEDKVEKTIVTNTPEQKSKPSGKKKTHRRRK